MEKITIVSYTFDQPSKNRHDATTLYAACDFDLAMALAKHHLRDLDKEGDVPFNIFSDADKMKFINEFSRHEEDGEYEFSVFLQKSKDGSEARIKVISPRVEIAVWIEELDVQTPDDWRDFYIKTLK